MWERIGRWLAGRRRNWTWEGAITAVVAVAVALFVTEMLEREVGDESALVIKIVVVGILAVLLLVKWVRNDPSADHDDGRYS
jgi:hypothetical protein